LRKRESEYTDWGVSEYAEEVGLDFIYENGELKNHLQVAGWWFDWDYDAETGKKVGGQPYYGGLCPLPNVWFGVSVEDQKTANERIPLLLQIDGAIRWLSLEPLLGPIDLTEMYWPNPQGVMNAEPLDITSLIDWAVIGLESNGRCGEVNWIVSLLQQLQAGGACPFVKQLGSKPIASDLTSFKCPATLLPDGSGYALRLKDKKGGDPNEWPKHLRVREFPQVKAVAV
jgi:hypothetical protein